jgi:integrase
MSGSAVAAALFTPPCKPEREKRVMSPEDIRLALGVLGTRDRLIFRMAVFDGMRPGEILAIRIGNISGDSVMIDQRAYKGTSTHRRAAKERGPREPWGNLLERSPNSTCGECCFSNRGRNRT